MKIYYDLEKEWRCSADGVRLQGNPPVLRYKEKPVWTILFLKDGYPCGTSDFGGAISFRAAVDVDLNADTEVICRTTDESIGRASLSSGKLTVPINANTSGFRIAADGQESRKAFFELWGFDTNADPVFYVRFEIRISGVVDPEGGVAPESVVTDAITRTEVMACLRAPDERQYTSDPTDSSAAHSSQTSSDTYTRRRNSAVAGEWGPWEALVQGPAGSQGSAGSNGSNGSNGSDGADGVSPSCSVTQTSSGAVIVTSDAQGETSATVLNGSDGSNGISPVVSVTQTSSGAIVYTSDYNGSATVEILNGSNGTNGTNGTNGSDGVSPTVTITQTSSGAVIVTSDGSGESSATILNGPTLVSASQVVSSLTSGALVLDNEAAPYLLKTSAGSLYPVEKGTIAYSSGTWTIDPAAYLAYEGTSAFAGPWTVYFAGGTADGQGKANTNLANVTSSGKDAIVDIAFELDWANASNVAALSTVYTASRAGIIAIGANLQSPAGFVEAYVYPPTGDTPSFASVNNLTLTQDRDNYVWVFVPKGCRYQVGCSSGATLSYARFIPFKNSIANS